MRSAAIVAAALIVWMALPLVLLLVAHLVAGPARRRNRQQAWLRYVDAQIAELEKQFPTGNVADQTHRRDVA